MRVAWMGILILLATEFSAMAAKPSCENEMLNPARSYLKTLSSAVNLGDVTTENLQWLVGQPEPVDPIIAPKSPQNISFKQKLRKQVPWITPAQWDLLKNEVRRIIESKNLQAARIESAVDETADIFSILPTGFKFPAGERVIQTFTSASGDTFIFTHSSTSSFIYNLRTQEKIEIKGQTPHYKSSYDFYESTGGDVLFAITSDKRLVVVNALTGQKLLSINDILVTAYDPLIFESRGQLNIALGSRESSVLERDALIMKLRIYFSTDGTAKIMPATGGHPRVVRLKDGHLYGQKLTLTQKEGDLHSVSVKVRDLTLEQDAIKVDGIDIYGREVNTTLIYHKGPRLLLAVQGEMIYRLITDDSQFSSPLSLRNDRVSSTSLIYPRDEAIDVAVAEKDGKFNLEVLNVVRNKKEVIPLPFERASSAVTHLNESRLFYARDGLWTYVTEKLNRGGVKLHFYNLETKEMLTLETPFAARNVGKIFRDPTTGQVLIIVNNDVKPWELYQVFGPERFRQ